MAIMPDLLWGGLDPTLAQGKACPGLAPDMAHPGPLYLIIRYIFIYLN